MTIPTEVWLAVGGIVGAIARALRTRGQDNWGRETAHDAFIGALCGLLWQVPLFGLWPPFELSDKASLVQRAALVAAFTFVAVDVLKRVLMKVAPAYLEKLGAKLGAPDQPSPSEPPPADRKP